MRLRFWLCALILICELSLDRGSSIAAEVFQASGSETGAAKSDPKKIDEPANGPNPKRENESDKGVTKDAELGLIGALAGAVVGGLIAWMAGIKAANKGANLAALSDRKKEEEAAHTVRAMLDAEIELNLQMLREEKARLGNQPEDRTAFEWLSFHPCPKWSTVVWEHSVLLVHRALLPSQAAAVQKVYNLLHSLTVARKGVAKVLERGGHIQAEVSFDRAKEIMLELLANGNPLRSPK
jgi:hypothetical protein